MGMGSCYTIGKSVDSTASYMLVLEKIANTNISDDDGLIKRVNRLNLELPVSF